MFNTIPDQRFSLVEAKTQNHHFYEVTENRKKPKSEAYEHLHTFHIGTNEAQWTNNRYQPPQAQSPHHLSRHCHLVHREHKQPHINIHPLH